MPTPHEPTPPAIPAPARTGAGISWLFGDDDVNVDGVLQARPDLKGRACAAYLVKHETCDTLPKEHLRADSALANVRALMPGLDFRIEEQLAFSRIYRQRTQEDVGEEYDALFSVPHEHDDQWRLLLRSTDRDGLLVPVPLFLEMLGQYALFRAAGVERTATLDVTLIAGFDSVQAILRNQGIGACEYQLIRGSSFMAAYALAHFMGLDQRLVTFGLLCATGQSEAMAAIFGHVIRERGDVLAFDNAMRVFLRQTTGASRETWRAAESADRLRMVSEAAAALIAEGSAGHDRRRTKAEPQATVAPAIRTLH